MTPAWFFSGMKFLLVIIITKFSEVNTKPSLNLESEYWSVIHISWVTKKGKKYGVLIIIISAGYNRLCWDVCKFWEGMYKSDWHFRNEECWGIIYDGAWIVICKNAHGWVVRESGDNRIGYAGNHVSNSALVLLVNEIFL